MGVRLPPGALFLDPSGNINFVKKYRHIFLAFFIACSQSSTDVSSEQEAPPTTEAPPTIASEELSEKEKCAPVSTATCDPQGNPISPDGGGNQPPPGGNQNLSVEEIDVTLNTIVLGGGKDVRGAEGIALDENTGYMYIGLNGSIISGCDGDASLGGQPVGGGELSAINPISGIELFSVKTGGAPIWPTVDRDRGYVYVMGSGDGTVTTHELNTGSIINVINIGGKPHQGGLDYSSGKMVIGNTFKSSEDINQQKYSSILNINSFEVEKNFESSPGAHGMAVDQDNDLVYFSSVADGMITVVDINTNEIINTGAPKDKFGSDFGGNNMLTRQDKTGRLFQANTQSSATGLIVINEKDLTAIDVIRFANSKIPWGMWVDEANELLFAALPNANSVGVVDLKSLEHVLNIQVGECPYAVSLDIERKIGVSTNQGTPSINTSATVFDLCKVYEKLGRKVIGCP